ncbi:MAG TPA: MbnP family protein, partial [Candidatus Baltobacteraceae bacterium]|nr:MbnP family protein [Candidatus Baltobacteraceae bacterium]
LVATGAGAADLRVDFDPQFDGKPLAFDELKNEIASGQKISVTRLDFLLSGIALHRSDGTWIGQKNWFAFINAREGKTNFTLENIPAGNYDAIRFQIGLPPDINHGDATKWPGGHPLNPEVNGLYWGWSREYVFLALEGGWRNNGKLSGFSYHVATDRELMVVELPVTLDLNSSRELQAALDVGKIFSVPNKIVLSDTSDTTHSRTNDILAGQLRQNVENAFSVENVKEFSPIAELVRGTNDIEIARDATRYRLTISQFAPQPDLPRDNPLTVEGVSLGSRLFFDRRLSANNSESCATCHNPHFAFSQPRRFSRGADGDIGTRNAMTLENLAWKSSFFWDGRATTLREQVLQPIQNPIEMNEPLTNAVAKIAADRDYHRLFANAFGSPEITSDKIARALEQFLLVQVSFNSKFDRVMNGQEKFTDEEARGYVLFNTEYDPYHGQYGADCFHCHGGPLFQSRDFANNGLDSTFPDLGRYNVTKRAGDEGKFAVPSLRNVAVTAPYMHDGRFWTLEEVIEHYCTGMKRSATLDPNLAKHPDGGVPLSDSDKKALVAFLKTLTDEKFSQPVALATSAAK